MPVSSNVCSQERAFVLYPCFQINVDEKILLA